MLEYFSKNAVIQLGAVGVETTIPFTNQHLLKGCGSVMSGNTVQINKCGVYDVSCDLCVSANNISNLEIKLYVDGVVQPQTDVITSISVADNYSTVHIDTYITKQNDNCKCNPCSSPTTVYLTISSSVADTIVTIQTSDNNVYRVA